MNKQEFLRFLMSNKMKQEVGSHEYHLIGEIMHEADKLETLSQEWISKFTSPVDDEGRLYVWKSDLETLLVPTLSEMETVEITEEQAMEWLDNNDFYDHATAETVLANVVDKGELGYYGTKYSVVKKPVIPKFVADWLDDNIERYKTVYSFIISLVEVFGDTVPEKVWTYASENPDTMARAYLDGYIVEKEQKYYVMNNDNRMMLVRMMDGKTITEADPFPFEELYDEEKKSHRLTEQEIKDYDPRYWAFRKRVEELE